MSERETIAAGAQRVTIDRLGAQGDGIVDLAMGSVFVPFTLPGEQVDIEIDEAALRARVVEIVSPGSERIAPVCRHYTTCGGCALQHMAPPAYLAWKRASIKSAFAMRGLEVEVEPVEAIGRHERRRAVFAVRRTKKTVQLGFHAPRDHKLVELSECAVLHRDIVDLLPRLKDLVGLVLTRKAEARLSVTRADNGLEVMLEGARKPLTPAECTMLATKALALGLTRLSVDDEIIAEQMAPVISFAGVDVALPAGTFLQASKRADNALAKLVVAPLQGRRHVADLFCGVGTLSLPLARTSAVTSIDNDRPAITALAQAVRHAQGLKPVVTRVRDLFIEPMSHKELIDFDAVVFDPPRAGAKAQAQALAASAVPVVVAVSCNPMTLARDVRVMIDGGYRLVKLSPVDQFLYSPHVEAVAILQRD